MVARWKSVARRSVGTQPTTSAEASHASSPSGVGPVVGPPTPSPATTPPPVESAPTENRRATSPVPQATQPMPEHSVHRSLSTPAPTLHPPHVTTQISTVSEGVVRRDPRRRPTLERSRSEIVKQYIKRETKLFFGVEEDCEVDQQARWLDRRKRLALRKYGQLQDEHSTATSAYANTQTRDLHPTQPDVLQATKDTTDGQTTPRWSEPPVRRKDNVAKMTFSGLAYIVAAFTGHRPKELSTNRQFSRSYHPSDVTLSVSTTDDKGLDTPLCDEVFFDKPSSSVQLETTPSVPPLEEYVEATIQSSTDHQVEGGFSSSRDHLDYSQPPPHPRESYTPSRSRAKSWRRPYERSGSQAGTEVGCSRIWSCVLDRAFDNSNRRQYGMGIVGRMFGRSMKKSVITRKSVQDQLEDLEDYRPFFTYWVTTVQVLILIISLVCYGLGPIGFDLAHRSGQVLVTSLSLQQVDYQEPANFWIGPRAGDLIHLGAKFSPCMRKDAKIIKEIEKGREKERETACCIRNDDSGCVQSSKAECSVIISTWKKWSPNDSYSGGRISGSVCGLDPKFCEAPASVAPYEWPDDITKWPICHKTKGVVSQDNHGTHSKDKSAEHMVCEVIGHPCCIGIHGMCRITTKEYCDFVKGYFHEQASLCSQVSCLDDVCGMIPFFSPEVPDQFYRLWTSLFLHAGIIHLIITLIIQYFFMRDLEKLTGSLRIGIIYIGSGVAGNLASAIFVPYRAEVGPAGAQFGLLACLIVEVINVWPMLKHPRIALIKLICITLVLFAIGCLPWVDNYAHLFGFIYGFLLSYALMPFVSFGPYDRQKKIAMVWICLLTTLILFILLIILFYVIPVYDITMFGYFNCLPLTRDFCASQNINLMREEPVV